MDYDPMDYDPYTHSVLECVTRFCLNVTANDDMTLEKVESFYVTHDRNIILAYGSGEVNHKTIHNVTKAEIKIVDNERKDLYSRSSIIITSVEHCVWWD